jgi:hypothetical protein
VTFLKPKEYRKAFLAGLSVNIGPDGASLNLKGARTRPPETEPRERKETQMSNAKIAALVAALVLAASTTASAQGAKNVAPHRTRPQLVAWCKSHPAATADCKEVRSDTRGIRADRKEVRTDRRDLKADIKAGDKQEAKADKKELKADRKDIRQDRKDRRQDVRDARKDAHR